MQLDQQHKDEIEKKLTIAMIDGLHNGILTQDEAVDISGQIQKNMQRIQTKTDLSEFLYALAFQWDIFQKILTIEKGEEKVKEDKSTATDIESLTKQGKVDEALELSKAALGGDAK